VDERRIQDIRDSDPDIYEAACWVQRNRDRFIKPVFLPFLEMEIRQEGRFADLIKAVAGQTLLKVCNALDN